MPRWELMLGVAVVAALGCGSASLVKGTNDGGSDVTGSGGGGSGGHAPTGGSGGHGSDEMDGGADRAHSLDAGCSDDAGTCGG